MNYINWNNIIAKHFFNESKAGKEVLLYVNDEVITSLGEPFGVGVDDFIEAVKAGPDWTTRTGFCQKALQACDEWRTRGLEYPPYIAYLAFFVLASVTETGYAAHSYYPGFWKRLNEPEDSGMPPSFHRMIELWDDLEKWSREDKHEELGRFVARIRGGYMNVGLPRSQMVLSEFERIHLTNLFDEAGLDPTDAPSPELIPKILRTYGEDVLEKRTFKLLDSTQKDDDVLRKTLINVVLDELEEWDGSVEELEKEDGHSRVQVHTGLRLCFRLDSLAGNVHIYVRFKTGRMFPEDGLSFKGNTDGPVWYCREAHQGWSTPLTDVSNGQHIKLDGTSLDWDGGGLLMDDENHWWARLRAADVRLFRLGVMDGLPDWVETQKLERGKEFFLAVSKRVAEKVMDWANEHCGSVKKENISGLPNGWILLRIKDASASCPGVDVLSVSTFARLLLIEGVKSGRGNAYFKFAPPKVALENSSGSEKVTMNGKELRRPDMNFPVWILPGDTPVGRSLRIEVVVDEHRLSKIIRLEEFALPINFEDTPSRNVLGNICEDTQQVRITGSVVEGKSEHVSYPAMIPTHLGDKMIFIGENPGQIVGWPHEPVPSSWHPVWAIACRSRKRWDVFFCGTPEQLKKGYSPDKPVSDRQCRKSWKEALWVRRKITVPPGIKSVNEVWNEYVRAARNV